MENRIQRIEQTLKHAFKNCELIVIDESHLHAGHAGTKTGKGHFRLRIKAKEFQGKSRVESHKMIYQVLDELFKADIHALGIEIVDD